MKGLLTVKYTLSDKDILQLNLLIPISQFRAHLDDLCPPTSTIYRKLKKHKVVNPSQTRKDFDLSLLKQGFSSLRANGFTDKQRWDWIKETKQAVLAETVEGIKRKAERHQEMYK